MIRLKRDLVVTVIIAVLFVFALVETSVANPEPIVSVTPPEQNVSVGDTFTVSIYVDPGRVEIYSARYNLYFNAELLNASAQTQGTFLSQDGAVTNVTVNIIDNQMGVVEYAETKIDVTDRVTPPGTLASITFEAKKPGISNLSLSDVELIDASGNEIQNLSLRDGVVEIKLEITEFDTGPGTYPSIMGVHKGTITPYYDINVSQIYTYPYPGTGGHSEVVSISGNGLEVREEWRGYQGSGDYHIIKFDTTFVLKANVTYDYEIITGSYPQIHHTDKIVIPEVGEITCSEFIDANGKKYDNWIPAIRLGVF